MVTRYCWNWSLRPPSNSLNLYVCKIWPSFADKLTDGYFSCLGNLCIIFYSKIWVLRYKTSGYIYQYHFKQNEWIDKRNTIFVKFKINGVNNHAKLNIKITLYMSNDVRLIKWENNSSLIVIIKSFSLSFYFILFYFPFYFLLLL